MIFRREPLISSIILLFLSGLLVLTDGCKHEPDIFFNNNPSISPECNGDTVYFQNDILPLLVSTCATSGCHDAQTGREGVVLTDYNSVMKTAGINVNNPAESKIYKAIMENGDDRMPPSPATPWSQDQIQMLYTWIEQGALNNRCAGDSICDTTNVTFNKDVLPVFETYCLGCHNANNPSGGIDLQNFDNLAVIIDNGSLSGSINFEPGYSPMPKGGNQLGFCERRKIAIWAADTTLTPPPGGGTGHPCDPDTTYFENDVLPLLLGNCATTGCHNQTSHQEGVILTDYTSVMNTGGVKPGNPNGSKLYKVLFGGDMRDDDIMPPPPAPPFTTEQKNIIKNWILQGALNNRCDEDCDTTNVTFSGSVWPIISTRCTGCHTGSGAGGGVHLANYSDVVAAANNGSLMGSIRHEAGYSPMPKNSGKLPDCKINTIQIWINNGMPND